MKLFSTRDLGGGFRLHLRRTRAFKTVTARLILHADLDDGAAARALVPRVLGRGTRRLPSLRDMQVELDRLYGASLHGDAARIGERQVIHVQAEWVKDDIAHAPLRARMGELLSEYLHDPATDPGGGLRKGVIEQERKNQADEAAAIFDDKARYARHRLLEVMCRGEAFARPALGHEKEIRALGIDEVRNAHAALLARAPADLFLVGDLTAPQALAFAKGLGFHRRRGLSKPSPTRLKGAPRRIRTVIERQKVGQAKLAMGFRTSVRLGTPLYPALVLFNALFGGSPVGKLFKKVREEASLCYAVHSMTERTKGLVLVHAGIDAKNYGRARKLILAQLDDLRRGRITAEEARLSRGVLLSAVRGMRDSPGALIDFGLERAVLGLPADLDALLRELRAVTLDEVARVARTVKLDTVYLLRD
ncbi:MAG TPA: pitrilysin family protein [Planctomycetota bacterium]|nr:pitrilysin family protein [Planctomycetota bacterium]